LSELIKKYNFDIKKLDPMALKALDQFTGGKGVFGFPFVSSTSVMYYNKDIFDKFGAAYPKDGMTYDETYELAKRMTRSDGGINYRGLSTFHQYILRENPYGLKPINPTTGKASLNTEEWKKLFQNLVRFYQIPGNNRPTNTRASNPESHSFALEQTIAMNINNNDLNIVKMFSPDMKWDVVSVPTYADKPKMADQSSPWMYSILKTSKNKEAAFEVLSYLVSDEFLMMESKRGVRTPTTNDAIKKAFGADSPLLKGKNIGAYYYYPSAPSPTLSGNPDIMSIIMEADNIVNNKLLEVIIDGKDINTVLRSGDEEVNKLIETKMNAKK
jgi:multiple sugar transport system substrate-binding protein